MLKDLIAIVDNVEASQDFVGQAVGFAEAQEAHLAVTLLTKENLPFVAIPPYEAYYPVDQNSDRQQEGLDALRRLTARTAVPVEIRGVLDAAAYLSGVSRVEGRYADVLLIGSEASFDDVRLRRRLIETAVMSSGGPVLILPDGSSSKGSLGRVRRAAVGWDASSEARRALRDLMTVIEPGGHIDIVIVDPDDTLAGQAESPGSEIGRYLARHGYEVEIHHESSSGGKIISGVLEAFALSSGADLLVIGAFAHPRIRDILLGGVTRELVAKAGLPLLLSR